MSEDTSQPPTPASDSTTAAPVSTAASPGERDGRHLSVVGGGEVPADRYARTLPSGRVATFLRRSTGDHVARASRLLRPEEQSNMLLLGWALATIVAKVDGDRFLVEDRGNFDRDDFLILSTEALQGKG